jgi:2-haloacid dehalogenase
VLIDAVAAVIIQSAGQQLTDRYVDFGTAQRAALRMIAQRRGRSLTADEIEHVVDAMSHLPTHPEVPDALAALRASVPEF